MNIKLNNSFDIMTSMYCVAEIYDDMMLAS